jgi:hypothetical protein
MIRQSSIQMSAVEQAVAGVSASCALVLVFRDSQGDQGYVAHSRELSYKHSIHAIFTDDLRLDDTCNHHDADLATEIFADVLHEVDHAFARVDDPICEDDGVLPSHVLWFDLFRLFSVVIHGLRECLEHAASNWVAASHKRNDESLAFVEEAVTLRSFALHSGELEAFDAQCESNVLHGEIPASVFVCTLELQPVHIGITPA